MFPHSEGDSIRFSVVPSPACSCVACASPSDSLHVAAGVAVPLDPCGHHRAACARVGVLGRRGFALETAAARGCQETGGRVMTNTLVRDMDLAHGANNTTDGLRLEVVVDGLSLFHGAQLAIDTTVVSALRADGTPRPRAARKGGAALDDARARKEFTYPELVGEGSRAKLVVLAAEVGGRWSAKAAQFIRALAVSKATSAPEFMQASVAHAWCHRWRRMLACTAAKAFANSLLKHCSPVSAGRSYPVGARRESGRPSHEMGVRRALARVAC